MPTFKATPEEIADFERRYGSGLQVRLDPPHPTKAPVIFTTGGTGVYLGIDPGASGGMAVLRGDHLTCIGMPETERDIWDWIAGSTATLAIIEKVGGFIKGNPAPGSAMFNFGQNYGSLRMALIGLKIPFVEAQPQKWLKSLGIPARGKDMSTKDWKNSLKRRAQQMFPNNQITLSTADAALIAEYCRRSSR